MRVKPVGEIEQALSILAATARQSTRLTRRGRRILKRAIANLEVYQARKGAAA